MARTVQKIAASSSGSDRIRNTGAPEPEDGQALFEALVCEFHWTVLQIAAIANCIDASASRKRAWMLRSCTNLLPVQSAIVTTALASWQEIGLPPKLSLSIGKVYSDLTDAKRLTIPVILDAGAFTGPAVSLSKLEQLSALWRSLSEDCETAI
ncbi:MAG: hypothetical protein QM780_13525 [Hyphomicrobium sp.]|uniref:hypothetical protein n=1 Tax=Hyphomicrobium sp. TaxID=82 RepID=UPI0039E58AC2